LAPTGQTKTQMFSCLFEYFRGTDRHLKVSFTIKCQSIITLLTLVN